MTEHEKQEAEKKRLATVAAEQKKSDAATARRVVSESASETGLTADEKVAADKKAALAALATHPSNRLLNYDCAKCLRAIRGPNYTFFPSENCYVHNDCAKAAEDDAKLTPEAEALELERRRKAGLLLQHPTAAEIEEKRLADAAEAKRIADLKASGTRIIP